MDVPSTVAAALEDRPVDGAVCFEAGAGVGNATAGLLARGARRVYAVTDDSVGVVTAHGLFNVLPPAAVASVAAELTRVAAPGSHLVVDDYAPLPDETRVSDLFAVENAAAELADGRPALSFYPAAAIRRLFAGLGWAFDRERTLLDPVPWTASHVEAHAEAARETVAALPARLRDPLLAETERVAADVGDGGESAGEMYSLAMRLPAGTDD